MSEKFRFFLATVSYNILREVNESYTLIRQNDGAFERTDDTFETALECVSAAIDLEGIADALREKTVGKTPSLANRLFPSRSQAMNWINERKDYAKERGYTDIDYTLDDYVLDTDDLDAFKYMPTFEVVLEIKTVKHLTVEITPDHERYDECEDEFDASDVARDMFESGDLEEEFEYADEYDTDVDIYSSSES